MSQFRSKVLDLGGYVSTRVLRDHTKRKVFQKNEIERQALRYLVRNTQLPQRVRAQAALRLQNMHCYTRSTQINSRCIQTGRGRGVFRAFRLARNGSIGRRSARREEG